MSNRPTSDLEHTRRIIERIVRSNPGLQIPDAPPVSHSRTNVLAGPPFPATVSLMVSAYALLESPPQHLFFGQHLLHFNGFDPGEQNLDLIWGVYGTESMGRAGAYAAMDARRLKRRLYQIDLWYRVTRRLNHSYNSPMSAEEIRRTGFMQLSRIEPDYREHLRAIFLERLHELGDSRLGELRMEPSLEVLTAHRPMLIHWLMRLCPWLYAVQHTVYVGTGIALRIVTMRRDPERYLHVSTRHHPEIVTNV